MYEIHLIATWLHILSAVYWIGAILFTLTVLGPTIRYQPEKVAVPIMSSVQNRVRSFVLSAIIIFIATGLFNLYYRGMMDSGRLFNSPYGAIFLIKMVPVAIMFAIYFSAPLILKRLSPDSKGTCCEIEEGPKPVGKVFAILHLIALACGLLIVFLGVILRG
jgi:uncharacterized membrane protein